MKYDVTLKGKVYEVVVEHGEAILVSVNDVQTSVPAAKPAVAASVASAAEVASTPAASSALSGETVSSPLPGVVISVAASVGTQVKKGQVVVIIEAMKMENEVIAPRDGKVSAMAVEKGTKVDTGAPLFSLE
ncbi:MAG: acetyl-CoA carboxylase biotin carboxyl carrier protein subunit [Oscillospiraceae bacterium]|jgi:glutaconyl-CoA decarboxylase|nr:acetyl-CoA carboxylase biotin carboxyl carrier protein subunit [Oscillospiraceae bacterium]